MPVETVVKAAPQYQATEPNRVEIPGVGQGAHIILSRPDLGGTFNSAELAQPKIPLAQIGLESKKPSILNLRTKEKLPRVVLTIKDTFAKGSERFNRIRPRRPRRPRCLHGKLKTEPCERCSAEVKSKNKS